MYSRPAIARFKKNWPLAAALALCGCGPSGPPPGRAALDSLRQKFQAEGKVETRDYSFGRIEETPLTEGRVLVEVQVLLLNDVFHLLAVKGDTWRIARDLRQDFFERVVQDASQEQAMVDRLARRLHERYQLPEGVSIKPGLKKEYHVERMAKDILGRVTLHLAYATLDPKARGTYVETHRFDRDDWTFEGGVLFDRVAK